MKRDISEELDDRFYLFGVGVLVVAMIIFILCYGQEDMDSKLERAFDEGYGLFIDGKEVFGNSNPIYHNSNGYKITVDNNKRIVNFESIQ